MELAENIPGFTRSDRLGLTTFVSILVHMVIILGISFAVPKLASQTDPLPTLEVTLVNGLIESSGRRVDLVHLVMPKEPDRTFFEGADDLRLADARLYLGLIHEDDSLGDNLARIRMAEEYYPQFGTSYVCGFGRRSEGRTRRSGPST